MNWNPVSHHAKTYILLQKGITQAFDLGYQIAVHDDQVVVLLQNLLSQELAKRLEILDPLLHCSTVVSLDELLVW